MDQSQIEHIAPNALPLIVTSARQKTWQSVEDIRNIIEPGMTEKQAIQKANAYFAAAGVRKFWHKTHIRFGASTVFGFNDPYLDDVVLKENDIFYVDVGPIWDGIEGDCGDTFVIGHNTEYDKIKTDVKILFNQVQEYWREKRYSGKKLYSFANTQAEKMGYKMQPNYVKGHRLSEFSHAHYTDLCLFDVDFVPSSERWVLELQICHPSMKFGAFYEDILI